MSRYIAVFSSTPSQTLARIRSLSPAVAVFAGGGIILSVPFRYEEPTLEQLLQSHAGSGRLHFGSASTWTAALFAARFCPGTRVPAGREADFMAPLSIGSVISCGFEIDPGLRETLRNWGIHRLGQLAQLPEAELVSRLGEEGQRLQKLSRGLDLYPFQPDLETPRYVQEVELDWEIEGLEPLAFVLGTILDNLCRRLQNRGLACDRLQLCFGLRDGSRCRRSVSLASPMRSPKVLLSLVRLRLQSDPPAGAVTRVWIEAHPAKPQIRQHSLLEPSGPNPEKLSRTLSRLAALVGEQGLGSPRLVESHRPDTFHLHPFQPVRKQAGQCSTRPKEETPRLVLRRFRPPRPARIQMEQVVSCSGPWRCSGEWWKGELVSEGSRLSRELRQKGCWSRDEWDIQFSSGEICRVYWDRLRKCWFLEGVYD